MITMVSLKMAVCFLIGVVFGLVSMTILVALALSDIVHGDKKEDKKDEISAD